MTNFEYRCDLCKYETECVNHDPKTCGRNMATVTCGLGDCEQKIRYPAGANHPRYCKKHEQEVLKRMCVKHRRLDSFGVTDAI